MTVRANFFPKAPVTLGVALITVVGSAPASAQVSSGVEPSPGHVVLDALAPYAGHWLSDEKTTAAGDRFHFEYELGWVDDARTVARMIIYQVTPDDGRTVVFDGFKGLEPSGEAVYYVAASPSGRVARGSVRLEETKLVTAYDGWGPDGSRVRIRDIFDPVRDGTFESRTFMRPSPDAPWRQIGADRWTRRPPQPS